MKDLLTSYVNEMRDLLVKSGLSAKSIDTILTDKVDHALVYDKVVNVRLQEFRRYAEVRLLQPEATWAYYAAREIDTLEECKLLRSAAKDLRHAWRSRVLVFAKKEADADKEPTL